MFAIAAAANWQFRWAIRKESGTDQREAEKRQQQRCERAPHSFVLELGDLTLAFLSSSEIFAGILAITRLVQIENVTELGEET